MKKRKIIESVVANLLMKEPEGVFDYIWFQAWIVVVAKFPIDYCLGRIKKR